MPQTKRFILDLTSLHKRSEDGSGGSLSLQENNHEKLLGFLVESVSERTKLLSQRTESLTPKLLEVDKAIRRFEIEPDLSGINYHRKYFKDRLVKNVQTFVKEPIVQPSLMKFNSSETSPNLWGLDHLSDETLSAYYTRLLASEEAKLPKSNYLEIMANERISSEMLKPSFHEEDIVSAPSEEFESIVPLSIVSESEEFPPTRMTEISAITSNTLMTDSTAPKKKKKGTMSKMLGIFKSKPQEDSIPGDQSINFVPEVETAPVPNNLKLDNLNFDVEADLLVSSNQELQNIGENPPKVRNPGKKSKKGKEGDLIKDDGGVKTVSNPLKTKKRENDKDQSDSKLRKENEDSANNAAKVSKPKSKRSKQPEFEQQQNAEDRAPMVRKPEIETLKVQPDYPKVKRTKTTTENAINEAADGKSPGNDKKGKGLSKARLLELLDSKTYDSAQDQKSIEAKTPTKKVNNLEELKALRSKGERSPIAKKERTEKPKEIVESAGFAFKLKRRESMSMRPVSLPEVSEVVEQEKDSPKYNVEQNEEFAMRLSENAIEEPVVTASKANEMMKSTKTDDMTLGKKFRERKRSSILQLAPPEALHVESSLDFFGTNPDNERVSARLSTVEQQFAEMTVNNDQDETTYNIEQSENILSAELMELLGESKDRIDDLAGRNSVAAKEVDYEQQNTEEVPARQSRRQSSVLTLNTTNAMNSVRRQSVALSASLTENMSHPTKEEVKEIKRPPPPPPSGIHRPPPPPGPPKPSSDRRTSFLNTTLASSLIRTPSKSNNAAENEDEVGQQGNAREEDRQQGTRFSMRRMSMNAFAKIPNLFSSTNTATTQELHQSSNQDQFHHNQEEGLAEPPPPVASRRMSFLQKKAPPPPPPPAKKSALANEVLSGIKGGLQLRRVESPAPKPVDTRTNILNAIKTGTTKLKAAEPPPANQKLLKQRRNSAIAAILANRAKIAGSESESSDSDNSSNDFI